LILPTPQNLGSPVDRALARRPSPFGPCMRALDFCLPLRPKEVPWGLAVRGFWHRRGFGEVLRRGCTSCLFIRGIAAAPGLTFFASPKESKQRKASPAGSASFDGRRSLFWLPCGHARAFATRNYLRLSCHCRGRRSRRPGKAVSLRLTASLPLISVNFVTPSLLQSRTQKNSTGSPRKRGRRCFAFAFF
jgi:hypothetical protein